MDELIEILKKRKAEGRIVERDAATHALLLINNGWPADKALAESERTLNEADVEGQY